MHAHNGALKTDASGNQHCLGLQSRMKRALTLLLLAVVVVALAVNPTMSGGLWTSFPHEFLRFAFHPFL